MIKVDEKERIRKEYFRKRKSIREIAREFQHARKTVKKALMDPYPPVYKRKTPPPEPVLGPVKPIIDGWLSEDKDRPRKQRHTARRIYHRLKKEYSFKGSESTVRKYVRSKKSQGYKEVFLPLEYDRGSDAQGDFGEAYVIMNGSLTLVQLFCMRLCYSRKPFVAAFPFQKQEAFFEGHVRSFNFFEGVPYRITWDNLKSAVKKILTGKNREEQTAFITFRSYYLFDSNFTTPGEAHEKGQVENLVGYARRNFLVPLPRVESFDELNEYLFKRYREEDEKRLRGQRKTIGEMWEEEKKNLLPLPQRDFPCCTVHLVKANSYSLVSFERNFYSVPVRYAHHQLILKSFVDRVQIFYQEKLVASHKRLLGAEEEKFDPMHYLPLLLKKPGALFYAKPMKRWQWPPIYYEFLKALKRRHSNAKGTKEFIRILGLHGNGNKEKIKKALEVALKLNCLSFDAVKNILDQISEETFKIKPLDLSSSSSLLSYRLSSQDLAKFNLLLKEKSNED